MTDNNHYENKNLELPDDLSLPFFTYGIFKPGQLAYSKIKWHVNNAINTEINYGMKHRDGVPILIDKQSDYSHTQGFIITFKEGREKKAYKTICNTLLKKLYKWKTIIINETEVNILFGVDPDKGSDYIEGNEERINFDGKNDPFFKDAIELIERNLNSDKHSFGMDRFFELQMNYMLLWSAIDRFSNLKYNRRQDSWNRERFVKEKAFVKGIKKYGNEYHQPVYSTKDLVIHEYDVEDPEKTLQYYYTLRCNVVHRGKAMINDLSMLEQALKELLEIFKDILKDTFEE